jgi:hypothetical protein
MHGFMKPKGPRRKRGIFLALQGWQKLQAAIAKSEYEGNSGEKYTIQELGALAGIAPVTIARVLNRLNEFLEPSI